MQNIRSKIFLFVAALFLLCGLVGCSGSNDNNDDIKISFGENNYEILEGEKIQLTPVVENGEIPDSKFVWQVADTKVAVCDNGLVTGINKGKTTVTVSYADDPNVYYIVTIKVVEKKYFPIVTLSAVNDQMEVGQFQTLSATIEGTEFDAVITYSSINPNVATVDGLGVITAVGIGSTVVSVKIAEDGNTSNFEEYHFLITVVEPTYYITYELNGGNNNENNPYKYTQSECPVVLEEPTRNGYEFKGWYRDAAFTAGNEVTEINSLENADITLYAKWEVVEYQIAYAHNVSNKLEFTANCYEDFDVFGKEISVCTSAGGIASNWWSYILLNETGNAYEYEVISAGYLIDTINTTYDLGIFYHGDYRLDSDERLDTYNKLQAFKNDPESIGKKIYLYNIPSDSTSKADITVSVDKVEYETYTIEDIIYTLPTLTKNYYNFLGWEKDGQEITNIPKGTTGDVYLEAQWEAIEYSIDYELNEGLNNDSNPSLYTVDVCPVTLGNPTRDGYEFKGWYTDAAFTVGNEITTINDPSLGNIKLYAKWEIIEYTITYNLNGGSRPKEYANREAVVADFLADYNADRGTTHTAESFSSLGSMSEISAASLFMYNNVDKWGWLVDYISTVASNNNKNAYAVFRNYTSQPRFNAQNSNNIYAFAYELRGFIGGIQYSKNANFVTADYSQDAICNGFWDYIPEYKYTVETEEFVLAPAQKQGYKFLGWFDTKDNLINSVPKGSTGNIGVVAKWELIEYTITYNLNGGSLPKAYASREEIVAEFLADFNSEMGKSYTVDTFIAQGVWSVSNESVFMYRQIEKWGWLVDYIATVASNSNKHAFQVFKNYTSQAGFNAENSNNIYAFAYEIRGFVGGFQNSQNANFVSADYSQESIGNGFWNYIPAAQYNVTDDDITLLNPTRPDYEFLGWYQTSDFSDSAISTIDASACGDYKLYAKWRYLYHDVTYELDGGEFVSIDVSKATPIKSTTLTRYLTYNVNGYEASLHTTQRIFWFHIALVETVQPGVYKIVQITNTNSVSEAYDLMVVWHSSLQDASAKSVLNSIWTGKDNYIGDYVVLKNVPSAASTTASITMELYDSSDSDIVIKTAPEYSYKEGVGLASLATPEKAGYIFEGWYDNAEFDGSPVTNIPADSTSNVALYAKWGVITSGEYTITFDENGGSDVADITTTTGTSITLPTPTYADHLFLGWYLNDTLYRETEMGGSNLTLVAKWAAKTKDISFSIYDNTGNAKGIYFCDTSIVPNNSLRWQYKILLQKDEIGYKVVAVDAAKASANGVASNAGVTWTHCISSASENVSTYATVGSYLTFTSDPAVGNENFVGTIYS